MTTSSLAYDALGVNVVGEAARVPVFESDVTAQHDDALIEEAFEDTLAIVRTSGPATLLLAVQDGDTLPHIRTEGHHPADVTALRVAVRDELGLDAIVLGCRSATAADGVVRRLLVLEALDGGSGATDLIWLAPHRVRDSVSADPFQGTQLDDWLQELAWQPGHPDGRDWTVPGWWARATSWITMMVHGAGLGGVQAIQEIRAWEFSSVLRVQTDQADLYLGCGRDTTPLANSRAEGFRSSG